MHKWSFDPVFTIIEVWKNHVVDPTLFLIPADGAYEIQDWANVQWLFQYLSRQPVSVISSMKKERIMYLFIEPHPFCYFGDVFNLSHNTGGTLTQLFSQQLISLADYGRFQ